MYQFPADPHQPNVVLATSVTYEHYWNEIDSSQLNYLHFVLEPRVSNAGIFGLNDSHNITGSGTKAINFTPELEGLADAGYYNDRGIDPAKNLNYFQVGGTAGLDLSIGPLNSDVAVSETYLAQAEHGLPDIHLFTAAWTLNLSRSFGLPATSQAIGLKASYQDGVLEATRQLTKQWLLSLAIKY